ncbi:hypothetical protein [Streptomyces anulatus]|uniref:hypothetical protein n=1 Tax=Streptomyces anulatus TaxID=1892 RepID=UPI00341D62C9
MPDPTPASDRPADQLRAAAEKLRAASAAVPSDDWGNRPWHVEECSDTDTMESCPCIVAQGEHREFDQPQVPLIQYVADAETTEHAAWIALMHPGVGLAMAAWLDAEAATWAGDEVHNSCSTQSCTLDAALAVARQLLGTTTACPECGDTGACNGGPCPLLGTSAAEGDDESCGRFVPDTPRAPGLCASCGDAKGWHSLLATAEPAAPPAPADRAATPVSQAQVTTLSELTDDLNRRRDMAAARRLADDAAAGVQPPTESEALTEIERQLLDFALDLAADQMASRDGFDDEDQAALDRLRALATPPAAPAAPEEPTR